GEPEYFREMCERFAAQGRLHLMSLVANGRTIAMDVWLRGGEGIFQIKASYDEDYARYSPGQQLHFRAQSLFHENTDAAWIDTCTFPNNELLMRLYPDRRRITSFFIVLGRNWRDRATMRSFIALRPLHRRVYDFRQRRRSSSTQHFAETP